MSFSRPQRDGDDSNPLTALIREYMRILSARPILTKACTSACTGAIGNILAQLVFSSASGKKQQLNWHSAFTYAATGFVLVGPTMHYYYKLAEELIPKTSGNVRLKRLLFDRLVYTPAFLLVYLYFISILEGRGFQVSSRNVRAIYWIVYKMNLKVLTLLQYINLNYIPQQYRVLFGNVVSIAWSCYIATKTSR